MDYVVKLYQATLSRIIDVKRKLKSLHIEKNDGTEDENKNMSSFPARVDKVNVSGLCRTKDDYVGRVSDNLFKVQTFEELLIECNNAISYLNDLGIFKTVSAFVDVSKGKNASANGYEISFDGVELSRLLGTVNTEIEMNSAGSLKGELTAPNVWGRGERLSLNCTYSSNNTQDLNLRFTKPFLHTSQAKFKPELMFEGSKKSAPQPHQGYSTSDLDLTCGFSFCSYVPFKLSHSIKYNLSFCETAPISRKDVVPFFIRKQFGTRMASLIRLRTTCDLRDDKVFPKYGLFFRTKQEFSGLGGDLCYFSNVTHAEISIPLSGDVVGQVGVKSGVIYCQEEHKKVPITKLFTLGGPRNLRGFEIGGAGQHIDGYPCGAHSFWAVGLHLWMPLKSSINLRSLDKRIRTHFFYILGNTNSVFENMRTSAGVGIAFALGTNSRCEINYCIPLRKGETDVAKEGFQFAISSDFL